MAESPEQNSSDVVKLVVLSNGAQLDESVQIVSVHIDKAMNKIPTATLVVLDGDMPTKDFPVSNTDVFKPGSEIQIDAGYGQSAEQVFKGIVTKHSLKISGDNYARLVIECRDAAVAMTVGRKNANYIDSKDSDIVTKLIGNYSKLTAAVEATTTQHKELVQYYCSDWDFLLSRADANALLVAVDDGVVTVKPPQVSSAAELKVTYGEDLIEFHADMDARSQLTAVTGVCWDVANQAAVEEQVGPQTLNSQGDLKAADLADVIGLSAYRLQTSVAMEKTALKSWANGQQLKAGLARIRGRMKFQGSAKAKINTVIELDGVGNRFNGNVFVSAVNHEIVNGNWQTEVTFGMSPDWFAEQRDVVAPPAAGLVPGVQGLHIGVVMKLDEDPEGQHKIQVSVPVLQAETEGVWARLAGFYGSEGIGAFFIPEIGDEVVLGYFNNDPAHPVILGSLYSSKRTPPYTLTADNFTKAIVTKSELKLEFDDEKKITTLVTPGNNKIVISDEDKSILLQDQNDNKVELSASGIVLDSPKDITISAQGKVTIDAMSEISVSAQSDVSVQGLNVDATANVGFTAKGNATAELSASGQTTVKGAMVMIN